jgi:osmotically-inducible protein OsmY
MEADRAAEAAGQKMENAVEATKEAAQQAADATKDVASDALAVASEASITAKVKAALVGDADLSALKINVDTKGSVVTLHGEVPNQAGKDRAEQLAKAVEGVSSVNNLLTVK